MAKNLISIENLNKAFAEKIICDNVSFGIHENDRIGLIGVNGCGKSTFLKMLAGDETPDDGRITFRNNTNLGFLPQNPIFDDENTIYEQLYFGKHEEFALLREYHKALAVFEGNPTEENQTKISYLYEEIDRKDGWKIEVKAKSFLTQLGLPDFSRKVKFLSGGQKRRLDLARVLMDQPEIVVMDEPTNHLDIETIEWLQNYLMNYNGVVIFVTHDRFFLDAVTTKIMEIESGKVRFYEGNYSYYLKQKELEMIDIQRKETRRQAQLQKEMKWLQRGAKARTSKPKNHVDRVKELLSKSYLTTESELDISFQTKRMGKTILELKNIGKSYDELDLFTEFTHNFQQLERVGIIGANGCGKTTLLKLIAQEDDPSSGSIKVGLNTHFSYFKQITDDFNRKISVLDYIRETAENIRTKDGVLHSASEMLQRFLFDGKMQQSMIKSLSGGERKRLYLLKSLMFGANFIILDEPTNDLDIKTLEILEDYLDAFRGCLLVVSHDRYFLDRVCDYLFVFEEDGIRKFPGNYSDYLLVKRFQDEERKEKEKLEKAKIERPKKVSKKLSYNEQRELTQLEGTIEKLESRQAELEHKIENEAANLSATDFAEISQEQEQIEEKLLEILERWEELESKSN